MLIKELVTALAVANKILAKHNNVPLLPRNCAMPTSIVPGQAWISRQTCLEVSSRNGSSTSTSRMRRQTNRLPHLQLKSESEYCRSLPFFRQSEKLCYDKHKSITHYHRFTECTGPTTRPRGGTSCCSRCHSA